MTIAVDNWHIAKTLLDTSLGLQKWLAGDSYYTIKRASWR